MIIDDIEDLLKLTDDELRETLIEDRYNKANLRETVRQSLNKIKEYKHAFEYERKHSVELEKKIERFNNEIEKLKFK